MAAKARGVKLRRPHFLVQNNFRDIHKDWRNKKMTLPQAADACGMSVGTFYGKAKSLKTLLHKTKIKFVKVYFCKFCQFFLLLP